MLYLYEYFGVLRHHLLESLFSIVLKRKNRIFTLRENDVPYIPRINFPSLSANSQRNQAGLKRIPDEFRSQSDAGTPSG